MNDGRSSSEPGRSWLSRITDALHGEPDSRDELIVIIRDAAERGLMDNEARQIIESTLKVSERQVREIMIPRGQMVSIRADEELRDFLPNLIESAHSRFPVLATDNPDEVLGILFAKDLLRLILENKDRIALKDFLRPAFFVPETTHIDKLIREFRSKKSHMAIVVNEYGGIAGLVTLEDALEQIVGEIDDEHDYEEDEEVLIRETNPNEWIVKAQISIAEFNEYFSSNFSNDEFDTMAGILLKAFERMPEEKEQIELNRFRFTIVQANGRALEQIKVEKR
ncbi:MAG: transporter associated domain-containing protein [Moraxellaceae bacterium]|nr:transporter associated domain-containing protein [Moraxellaceae bacterium]MDZ4298204.1 transporter associated domain-containing protein [Moraxellaceae bacterium]MDZ4386876.1 transporter associated domain-containing protein [Moraxellaceae bacterium]